MAQGDFFSDFPSLFWFLYIFSLIFEQCKIVHYHKKIVSRATCFFIDDLTFASRSIGICSPNRRLRIAFAIFTVLMFKNHGEDLFTWKGQR